MDPYILILLCTLSISIVGSIGAFLWQLLLSRDKQLNQRAHLGALEKEASVLETLRGQQEGDTRFRAHYDALANNSKSIELINEKINEILEKKLQLIKEYAEMVKEESSSMIRNFSFFLSSTAPSILSDTYHQTLDSYEMELTALRTQRDKLWTISREFQAELLSAESNRNEKLDTLYSTHTALLGKVYLAQARNSDEIEKASINAGSTAFKYSIFYPLQLLASFFGLHKSPDILRSTEDETKARTFVQAVENEINRGINSMLDIEIDSTGEEPALLT
jgi:hypothetical protein